MKFFKQLSIFKRNRSLAYTNHPKFIKAVMPQRVGLDIPLFAGRMVYINLGKGLINMKTPFIDFLDAVPGGFKLSGQDYASFVSVDKVKFLTGIIYRGDDYEKFFRRSGESNIISIMLINPSEIFGIPYTDEYFMDELQEGDPVTIERGYYRKAFPGEGIIGYFLGNSADRINLAHIKFFPDLYEVGSNM